MKNVISFGEVLWDVMPLGLFLGGAPHNVATHMSQLGLNSYLVSAVGHDQLGIEALERMATRGVHTRFITHTREMLTGTAKVRFNYKGEPRYNIRENVAWDDIHVGINLYNFLQEVDAFVYGSLSARNQKNRNRLFKILQIPGFLKVFDVNLRQPYDNIDLVIQLANKSDVVKLNQNELVQITGCIVNGSGLEKAIIELSNLTQVKKICVTRGEKGAVYFDGSKFVYGESKPVEVKNVVGAGDAFTAMFVKSLIYGDTINNTFINRCCRLGAFVATQECASPNYDIRDILKMDESEYSVKTNKYIPTNFYPKKSFVKYNNLEIVTQ